jgi:hypothetical protein
VTSEPAGRTDVCGVADGTIAFDADGDGGDDGVLAGPSVADGAGVPQAPISAMISTTMSDRNRLDGRMAALQSANATPARWRRNVPILPNFPLISRS